MKLWLIVTADKYEHIVCICESIKEAAEWLFPEHPFPVFVRRIMQQEQDRIERTGLPYNDGGGMPTKYLIREINVPGEKPMHAPRAQKPRMTKAEARANAREIVRLWGKGMSVQDIARRRRTTTVRVNQILREERKKHDEGR